MQDEDDLFGDIEEEAPQVQENKSFKDLRRHANKLEKDLSSSQAELEELRQFRDDFNNRQRQEQVGKVFTELGLNTAHVKFWQLENPEAEPDQAAISKWAVENGFAQETGEAPAPTTGGFTPTTTPEGVPPGGKRYTRDEWLNISVEDPGLGQRLLQQGRVNLSDVRSGLGPEK
jgi:hypothetical protein